MRILMIAFLLWSPTFGRAEGEVHLKVATYNVMGIPQPFLSRPKRLPKLAEVLDKSDIDIIAFQEAFTKRTQVLTKVPRFPYSVRGKRAKFAKPGDGLLLISRWPIVSSEFYSFKYCHGFIDCVASKGVLHARVLVEGSLILNVFVTHLDSQDDAKDEDVRVTQAAELLELVNFVRGEPLVILSDLNSEPTSAAYRFIRDTSLVRDSYLEYTQMDPSADADGYTFFPGLNTNLPKTGRSQRLDYIWIGDTSLVPIKLIRSSIILDRPTSLGHLSDHFGVMSELVIPLDPKN